jgi:hypothetical protein
MKPQLFRVTKAMVYARADLCGVSREVVEPCFVQRVCLEQVVVSREEWWEVDINHPAYPRCDILSRATPPLGRQVAAYAKEIRRWQKAGRPIRSDAEVERLYVLCSSQTEPCRFFKPPRKEGKKGRCLLCGCRINIGRYGLLNKLRMATTSCPDAPPKFTTEVIAPLG